ncbi:hypothetical protein BDQ17DRAFT_1172049, partial [Cyathus striatus]
YPPPSWGFQPITDNQIQCAISFINPFKAMQAGSIPNCIIKNCQSVLVPHLGPIFWGTFSLDYYPEEWACTEMIVL